MKISDLITVRQAAALCGISSQRLYCLLDEGRIEEALNMSAGRRGRWLLLRSFRILDARGRKLQPGRWRTAEKHPGAPKRGQK